MKVTLLMAVTVDGRIARDSAHFADWTSKADKKLFVQMTKDAGALIMGRATYATIGRPLPGRKNIVMTRQNLDSDHEDLVYTDQSPEEILEDLKQQGYKEVILGGGAEINSLWAEAGLIDEVVVTVAPMCFGEGLGIFSKPVDLHLELMDTEKIDEDTVKIHYKVQK